MTTRYIGTTELKDGCILRLSVQENPEGNGRDFYQLTLNTGKKIFHYPKPFEKYFTERDIWQVHDKIKKKQDFIDVLSAADVF